MTSLIAAIVVVSSSLTAFSPAPNTSDPDAAHGETSVVVEKDVEHDDISTTAMKNGLMIGTVAIASSLVAAGFFSTTFFLLIRADAVFGFPPVARTSAMTALLLLFGILPIGAVGTSAAGALWLNTNKPVRTLLFAGAGAAAGGASAALAGVAIGAGGLWSLFGPNYDSLFGFDTTGVLPFLGGVIVAPIALTLMGAGGIAGGLVGGYIDGPEKTLGQDGVGRSE